VSPARALFICGTLFALSGFAQPRDAGLPGPRPIVSVLYFDVDEKLNELTVFRKGLAELLITDLVAAGSLQVVERSRLDDALRELKLQGTKNFDPATAVRVGGLVGAQFQIVGSILPRGKTGLVIDARVVRLVDLTVVKSARAVLQGDDILEGEQLLVSRLLDGLADATRLPMVRPVKAGALPLKSAVKFAQALSAKDANDPSTARALLAQVVAEQPDFILARLNLAAMAR